MPITRVDLWMLTLVTVDPDAHTEEALGQVCFVSWPRPTMLVEVLHAVLSRLFGQTTPLAILLERPIIVPIARAHLWRTGEQLKALQGWLQV